MAGRPEFFVFGISHYCEKARWALDWHNIEYTETAWPPGPHIYLAKKAGARLSMIRMEGAASVHE